MAGSLGEAFVEIHGDTDGFAEEVEGALTDAFVDIRQEAERAADSLERQFVEASNEADEALRSIGGRDAFAPVRTSAEAAGESVQRSFKEAERQSDGHLKGIAVGAGAALAAVGAAGIAAAGAVVGFGLQQAAALEQTRIGFVSLLGGAAEADAFIREMQAFAASTPFEFPGLADASRRLLAVGEAAGITREEIIPTITKIGDLVSVLGAPQESLDRVVSTLGQVASKGRLQTEELLQLAEALPGFNSLQALADGLGITTAEVQKLLEKGAIPAKEGIDLLVAGMANFKGASGAMAQQATTLTGLFSTFKDTITLGLTEAFGPLVETVKGALGPLTGTIGEALKELAPALSGVVGGLIPLVGPAIEALSAILTPVLNAIGQALPALLPAVIAFGDALGEAFSDPEFAKALADIAVAMAELLVAVLPLLVPLIKLLVFFETKIGGPILVQTIQSFTMVAEAIASVATFLQDDLLPALETAGRFLADTFGPAVEAIGRFFTDLPGQGSAALEFFRDLPGNVVGFLGDLGPRLTEAAGQALATMAEGAGAGLEAVVGHFVQLPFRIAETLINLPFQLAELSGQLGAAILGRAIEWGPGVVQFFAELPGRLVGALLDLGPRVGGAFVDAFLAAQRATAGVINELVDYVAGTPGRIADMAPRMLEAGAKLIGGLIDGIKSLLGRVADVGRVVANAIVGFINRAVIDNINDALEFDLKAGPLSFRVDPPDLGHLPSFDRGGWVGGALGAPQLAVLHGGEFVQSAAMLANGGGGVVFGPGSVVVSFSGGAPSPQEARVAGQQVGQGIADVLADREARVAARLA